MLEALRVPLWTESTYLLARIEVSEKLDFSVFLDVSNPTGLTTMYGKVIWFDQ
jgi:hypothetical protein